jgi:antitoxin HigA-1
MKIKNGMRSAHCGEVRREYFILPPKTSVNAFAKQLGVPITRPNYIVFERRGITPYTALRLARYFGGDARSWLNLQTSYDLRTTEIARAKIIAREVAPIKQKTAA